MANGVTIDQPSWQQGFEDGGCRPSAPDTDAFSYWTGYLDGLNGRREQTSNPPPPADAPAPAAAPRPWWRHLVG
jgi:hypothetical protein